MYLLSSVPYQALCVITNSSPVNSNIYPDCFQIFGSSVEGLFSSDWKARETAILHISRESVSLLLPYIHSSLSKVPPMNEGATGSGGNSGDPREVQEVCMQVVTIAANDSVLKVFLAALVSYIMLY